MKANFSDLLIYSEVLVIRSIARGKGLLTDAGREMIESLEAKAATLTLADHIDYSKAN